MAIFRQWLGPTLDGDIEFHPSLIFAACIGSSIGCEYGDNIGQECRHNTVTTPTPHIGLRHFNTNRTKGGDDGNIEGRRMMLVDISHHKITLFFGQIRGR